MCECLTYDDGSMHLCEACAGDLAHYKAECERLRKRCEKLHKALRCAKVFGNRDPNLMWCKLCESLWRPPHPERHAPGCLCAPEAGPDFDAPTTVNAPRPLTPEEGAAYESVLTGLFDGSEARPPLQPASNPLRPAPAVGWGHGETEPAPGEEKSR